MFEDLSDLYQETILEHGRNPTHARRLEVFDATAKGDNPMCGDRVQVWVRRGADGRLAEVSFEARGCAISIASADLMAEVAEGRRAAEMRALFTGFQEMVRTGEPPVDSAIWERLLPLAGVHEFPSRVKCATLPWHALVAALDGGGEVSNE
jgi:nitrogen fixation protein NifU and related proteins